MHEPDLPDESTEPSRSQKRREALEVFELAEALVKLTEAQLARVPLSDELREEVKRTRAITQHIARKRQTQFLAKQLRRRPDELEPIRHMLQGDRDQNYREAAQIHRIENWRDRLIAEGDAALTELLTLFPGMDRQHLRQLIRQAQFEMEKQRPPHAARALFRELRELFNS